MNSTPNTETLLEDIWKNLHGAMDALENGGTIDMVSLDAKVRNFCDSVTTLPAEEARSYDKKLSEIVSYLGNIVDTLIARKNAVKNEIDITNQRQRANNAYGGSAMLSPATTATTGGE